jgi:hypothetical protein
MATRETDGVIWWDRAVLALADLLPTSAIAYALHRPDVWRRELRQELRKSAPPPSRMGFVLEDLMDAAETHAGAEASHVMSEVFITRAIAQHTTALQQLGISPDALVAQVTQRAAPVALAGLPARARILGAARARLLDESVTSVSLTEVLAKEERSGIVERKRSLILDDQGLARLEQSAVALVNGTSDAAVYLIFGQEDDGTPVGEVTPGGKATTDETVRKYQRRLDQRLQACHPPVPVKWECVTQDGRRIWLACLFGRAPGTAVRTSTGAYPYRSGEDTHFATPEQLASWLREPSAATDSPDAQAVAGTEAVEVVQGPPGASHRQALLHLEESVQSFFASPPAIPNRVDESGRPESWRPVYEPILQHFQEAIDHVVAVGIAADEDTLARLFRGIRTVFELQEPQGGLSWVTEAPRLVCRIAADRVLVDAYVTERWYRIPVVGRPAFDSYVGRVPWVVAPEYRHLETLGRHSAVADTVVLDEVVKDSRLVEHGLSDKVVRSAHRAVALGLGLCYLAHQEHHHAVNVSPPWVHFDAGVGLQMILWEEEPAVLRAFAGLAFEDSQLFASQLPSRFGQLLSAFQAVGLHVSPHPGWAAVDRIGQEAQEALDNAAEEARRRADMPF